MSTVSHDRGLRALIRRLRRGLRRRAGRWLARHTGTPAPIRAPLTAPRRILVCRINRRLGNCLFLTPLLRSLAKTYPDVRLEVLLRGQENAALIATLPQVDRVHVIAPRPLSELRRLWKLLRTLRARRFDLVVDPSINSVGDRIALVLVGPRPRLGFAGRDQWLRLTHAAPYPSGTVHQALLPLQLLTEAVSRPQPVLCQTLAVFPDQAARQRARNRLASALGAAPQGSCLVGFFAQATGRKQLPAQWWTTWHATLVERENPPIVLQLLPPGNDAPMVAGLPTVRTADLVELAALLAQLNVFVAADSGPMHLAAAAGVPVLGLFAATDPRSFAPLGTGCHALAPPPAPTEVARQTLHMLAAAAPRPGGRRRPGPSI